MTRLTITLPSPLFTMQHGIIGNMNNSNSLTHDELRALLGPDGVYAPPVGKDIPLSDLISQVEDILSPHLSIQADDDQYDDPVLWWAEPLLEELIQAQNDLLRLT